MARRFDCPRPGYEEFYIELPDEWLGEHSRRYDEAMDKAKNGSSESEKLFGVALALLDDWRLPGLEGKPENWDFSKMPLSVIGWVNKITLNSYWECFVVPKDFWLPSQNGQPAIIPTPADGN